MPSRRLKGWVNRVLQFSILRPDEPLPFCIESLEPRLLLSGALPPALVLGRTLSAYTTTAIENHQETITFTVYNEQADALTGVLLTDTLQTGVTVSSASSQPDQSGQQLAWSLGPIAGFDRASITLTVSLPSSIPLTLDTGAAAFATLDAAPVTNTTPAVTLRTDSPAADLLASTPDANTTDPFIQEEAAKLSYDPQQIFNFLHTQITYNSYSGSVRGARGTLWSDAGNSLDVASLGVALMRASGIPAQYVSGTLSQNHAQQLILSMFPAQYQTVGYIPNGTTVSDPANDPQLLAETESHYWFQFDTGSGMQDADPLIAGAAIGQNFTTPTGTFAAVDDSLRAHTEVKMIAEIDNTADSLFGSSGISDTTVLDQTFNDVDLVGRFITAGNLTNTQSVSALFTDTTNTYSPFLIVGDAADPDATQDVILRGQDYQEVLTSFPFGSQIVTGVFLNITLSGPGQTTTSTQYTMADRIGIAARLSSQPSSISVAPGASPIFSPVDVTTFTVMPASIDPNVGVVLGQRQAALTAQFEALDQSLAGVTSGDPAEQALGNDASSLVQATLIAVTRSQLAEYLTLSDTNTALFSQNMDVLAYFDSPRITIEHAQLIVGTDNSVSFTLAVDLDRDDIRAIAAPGQNKAMAISFNLVRGQMDTYIESVVTGALQNQQSGSFQASAAISAYGVMSAAQTQGVAFTLLAPGDQATLDSFGFSSAANALITESLGQGDFVLVPVHSIQINGAARLAWFQMNPTTGSSVGVLDDGTHAGIVGYTANLAITRALAWGQQFGMGLLAGGLYDAFFLTAKALIQFAVTAALPAGYRPLVSKALALSGLIAIFKYGQLAVQRFNATLPLFVAGFALSAGWGLAALFIDPPLLDAFSNPTPPNPPETNSDSASSTATASLSAGATTASLAAPSGIISGAINANWNGGGTTTTLQAQTLSVPNGTVRDGKGALVGSGQVALNTTSLVAAALSGTVAYSITGQGALAFYAPAESNLGIGANWDNYTANVSGTVNITLTTASLAVNGQVLPAGTYTIATTAAALTGSGQSTSPNFSETLGVTATAATINLGPASGTLSSGGSPLDATNGATLTGFTGTLNVSPNGGITDAVTLNGTTANAITVTANPPAPSTDQNTPITLAATINTTLADTYTLSALAPAGWTVAIDTSNHVTVTPAAGIQAGTYPVQIVAHSTTDSDLVAQTIVNVTITPTTPGIVFNVVPDTVFTVPFNGAQIPTAFRASIQNTGPTADTYNLTFSNLPAGFTPVDSSTSITIPAGQTGIVGIYLQPATTPPPGVNNSFTVTATSATDSAITQSQTVHFTVPAINALTITASPATVSTVPGGSTTTALTIANAGNTTENGITLTAAASSGLNITGLAPISPSILGIGQSTTQTITIAADSSTSLNSLLDATITATYGNSQTATVDLPVRIVVPGADALATAATAANTLGRPDLANRLNDLSTALTNLLQTPGDPVAKSQTLSSITALVAQFNGDPFLIALVPNFTVVTTAITNAVSANDVQSAATTLGSALATLNTTLTDEAAHSFTLGFVADSQVAQPQVGTQFQLVLQNTGTATTTYDLSVSGLPSGVNAVFSQPSITLDPGQVTPGSGGVPDVFVTLTSTSATDLPAFNFIVTATAHDATEITESATGSLAARAAFVQVVSVTPNPTFTNPGGQVDVSARILNAVNKQQQAKVSYTVKNSNNTVIFISSPVTTTLNVLTTLTTVDLGNLDTTGFATGQDTITVTVSDANNAPIPGATGTGSILIGTPVTATLTTAPNSLPPGSGTVTSTLQLDSQVPLFAPLAVEGQTAISNASSVAINGNTAYVGVSGGIDVVNISDPTHPTVLSTFGTSDIPSGDSVSALQITGNELVVEALHNTPSTLLIYSIANPTAPTLLGQTPLTFNSNSDSYPGSFSVSNNHAYIASIWYRYTPGPNTIFAQFGEVQDVDISNPAAPAVVNVIYNSPPDSSTGFPDGTSNIWQATPVNNNTLLLGTTSATGATVSGVNGQVLVVNTTDPANPAVVETLTIPGMAVVTGISVVGNQAFVVGSSQDWVDAVSGLGGNVVVANLDLTNPQSPTITSTQTLNVKSIGVGNLTSLGNHLFASSSLAGPSNGPLMLVFDDTNPNDVVLTTITVPRNINNFAAAGSVLLTDDGSNLIAYNIGAPQDIPVVAQVTVPTNGGVSIVPNSFSIAPTATTTGANSETLTWDLGFSAGNTSETISWQSAVTGLQPGQSLPITQEASVQFTSSGTLGTLTLPDTSVAGDQIIGLAPATQTVAPAAPADYTVTLSNPTASAVTYTLSVRGLPAGWANLQSSVLVAAGDSVNVPLTITSNSFASLSDYGFTVSAAGDNGAASSVLGDLVLAGTAAAIDPQSHGIVVTLTPTSATAGQGNSAAYTVQLTNTGSADETYTLAAPTLPAGVTATFGQTTIDVPPGASNFRDVPLTLTAASGTTPGSDPFTITASSTTVSSNTSSASGTLNVIANGVTLSLNNTTGVPGATFQLTVTNTGTVADTYDVALAGPAALAASFANNGDLQSNGNALVILDPGASQILTINTSAINFADPGALNLTAIATSRGNTSVIGSATATLTVPTTSGLSTAFAPATQIIPIPGTTSFLLTVHNTGNTEDHFTASITGITGSVTSTLTGIDGQPAQSIPVFYLPGLATGQFLLNANATATGHSTISVQVTSLTNSAVTSSNTAILEAGSTTPAVTLYSSSILSEAGQPVTFTTVVCVPGTGAPGTGTVTFMDGSTVLGTTALDANGAATISTSALTAGNHSITATYNGGGILAATPSNTVIESVNPSAPITGTPNEQFVESLYRNVLHRAAAPSEVAIWINDLNAGATRQQVALGFETSPEQRTIEVNQFYSNFLHRAPDANASYWVNAFLAGASDEQIEIGFVTSNEYEAAHPIPTPDIDAQYNDILQRCGDTSGRDHWVDTLTNNTPDQRPAVALDFLYSTESVANIVNAQFTTFLDRTPDASGFDHFTSELQGGIATPADTAAEILGSQEYFNDVTVL